MKRFNYRIDDIEVRATGKHLIAGDGDELTTCEIVKYDNDTGPSCYTLAYWKRESEGFDLKFVGGRPFDVDPIDFMRIAKVGQEFLDEFFDEQEASQY